MSSIPEEITTIHQAVLSASTVTLRSDGIIQVTLHPTDELTLADAHEIVQAVKNIGNKKNFPYMITAKEYVNVSKEARAYSASEEGCIYTLADALVVNSTALKLIANFYMSFNKPIKPTRIFNSEEKAVAWLKTFL